MPRLMLVVLVIAGTAQAQDCVKRIPIAIFDQKTGWSMRALTPLALEAKVRDAVLPIAALDYVTTGRLFILIDESGSMAETAASLYTGASVGSMQEAEDVQSRYKGAALHVIKQTVRDFITNLPPGLSVQYGLFNQKWVFSEAFISDPKELGRRIDDVNTRFGALGHGRTALYDALHEALSRFHEFQPGDSILLITDGADNRSKLSVEKLEREFHTANVRLLGIVQLPSLLEETGPDWIRQISENTGGYFLGIDSASRSWQEKKGISENVSVLRNFWSDKVLAGYMISIQVPATLKSETKWKLAVKRESDVRLKHAGVVYPDRLSPCSVTSAQAP